MSQKQTYIEDQYLKEKESKVLKINGDRIWLEDNIFHPKTKGEPSDQGEVNGIQVTDVLKEGNEIAVILEKEPDFKEGEEVLQRIDWEYRYQVMKFHTALHFLTGIIEKEHKFRAVAGNIFPDKAVLTYKQALPEMIIYPAEDKINELINKGLEVKTYFDEKKEDFRWCKIGDFEPIPCGGIHVHDVKEIGKVEVESKGDKVEIRLS